MRIRSGIIAIATLAVLAAVITTLALSSFTAEAQGNPGTVANLQLSSTTAGILTVSWDAASPTPTDYRVDWAKSTEDYKSWKVDDGHVYPAETATTTTITDLDHDTEYKIRMRARYYRGEHEGKSWGGPWATATITVAGEPTETPTPEPVQEEEPTTAAGAIDTLTATDDDTGQLVLTWEAPAAPNATPTDYHVNWAKSTEDYPADTAGSQQRPSKYDHPYVGRPRVRHRVQRQGTGTLHGRRERRQPLERALDRDNRPSASAAAGSAHHGRHRGHARQPSLADLVQHRRRRLHHRLPDPART